jgi:lipid-A-disaccharide synthase
MQKKKIYYVAGEKSGDQLADWHSNLFWPDAQLFGVAGDLMQKKMKLDLHIDQLSCIGGLGIIFDLPRLYRLQKQILNNIIFCNPDQVILVNFSSFNLSLAAAIKKQNPHQKIIFFSPPQLWIWGAWRVKKIKKYIDEVQVIFPFEVEWYLQRGIKAFYVGSPVFDRFKNFKRKAIAEQSLLCLPGSRKQELAVTLPLFIPALALMQKNNVDLKILIGSAHDDFVILIDQACQKYQLKTYAIVKSDDLMDTFASATCALTKPGTNTLELAFAGIPTIVAYKMPWVLYFLARLIIKTKWTALPNLILKQEMFKEIIQFDCRPKTIAHEVQKLFSLNRILFDTQQEVLRSCFESEA